MFCPNCGTQCDPSDNACRNCGQTLRGRDGSSSGQQPASSARPTNGKRTAVVVLSVACGILIIAIVAIAVTVLLKPSSDNAPTQSSSVTSAAVNPTNGDLVQAMDRPLLVALNEQALDSGITPSVKQYSVEPGLSNITNAQDTYLSDEAKEALENYGFVIDASWGNDEFFEIYESNRYNQYPNFVTVDSLMHTYHLYFQHLLKTIERTYLSSAILGMSQELLQTSEEQLAALKGTEWEEAALRNVAFFSVGAALQDPSTQIPSEVADVVASELAAIEAGEGIGKSSITGDDEDYTQYKPRGYYEGDAALEAYFRTMMWYGRINFKQADEDLDRSALLMNMALTGEALERWEAVYTVTGFFAGASDDCGYFEYKPCLDAAFGEGASVNDLVGATDAWQSYHELTAQMRAPQINSVPLGEDDDPEVSRTEAEKGYRLMGQRFTLDEAIFEWLTYPESGSNASGDGRMLPDALDVPAALGSDIALQITQDRGASEYANYDSNVESLRSYLTDETNPVWSQSLYSQWLYTINPLLAPKDEGYPSFMRTEQWLRKDLQSYLGSYTELKHDTVLYAKQMMAEMGGGPLEEKDDRGYVEPEPEVFLRLANLTSATSEGLNNYGMLGDEERQNLELLRQLATQLSDIATKELTGEAISDDEYELIRSYGGQLEHFWQEVYKDETDQDLFTSREFPSAVVVDVATNGDAGTVLELGTGKAYTMYVVVPVDGSLRIASGSVFSFYQFEQPMSNRLTDTEWRQMMGIEMGDNGQYQTTPAKQLEDWTQDFTTSR